MKALKLYALVGTFAILTAITLPQLALAWDKSSANQQGIDRGVRLDELFNRFFSGDKDAGKPQIASKTPSATELRKPPVLQKSDSHHATSGKTAAGTTAAKTGEAAGKATSKDGGQGVELAVYKNGYKTGTTLAVAHLSDSATPVLEASLDHPKGKDGLPHYKAGETMVIKLTARRDCNAVVFDYAPDGTLTQLFPNDYVLDPLLKEGQTYEIGGPDCKYALETSGSGQERIFVYAYPVSEGPITVAMNPVPNTPFRAVKITHQQYDRLLTESRGYFNELCQQSGMRNVSVVGKHEDKVVPATASNSPPNKLQLVFQIEK